ncbi:AAA family ATPase, partial [bacterium]|nr:AAA family ATPase [bacterium]
KPGVGKTLMASCPIKASGRPVFRCRKEQGSSELIHTIERYFDEAAKCAPSIVFLDDLDKFANNDERHCDTPEYAAVQSCIDKYRQHDVFVVATVNRLRSLPRSLYRSGRFDKVIRVGLPKYEDAVKIIEHYMQDKPVKDLDCSFLARIAQGHSCADIETVLNTAAINAGYQRCEAIEMDHIINACRQCLYHIPDFDQYAEDEEGDPFGNDEANIYSHLSDLKCSPVLQRTAYHEAGHAVLQELLFPNSVNFVSLKGKKNSLGGYISIFHPENDASTEWEKARIIVHMGGRAAVELKFSACETCISDDLENVWMIIRRLREIGELGFGYNSALNSDESDIFRTIVANKMNEAYGQAQRLLLQNYAYLERVAAHLIEHHQITSKELQALKSSN